MRELRDKVAVVTGAGSGIGRALARRLAREGCNLVLADISPDALADVDAELVEAGTRTAAIEADVTDQDSVDALAEAALTAFGAVHVVCNNAGVGVPRGGGMYVWDTPLPEYEWVMRTNVWGIIHGCRAFVPILLAQGEPAHIVNTVSVAGLLARAATHVYTMSKHAALSLSESLVAQLAEIDSSIGVSLLCPGYVDTGLSASDTSAPPAVAALAEAETAEHAEMRARFERSIGRGIAPDLVAAGAIDAILTGRTYVLTHPEYNELIRLRVADIMERGTLEQYGEAYRSFARRQGAKAE
ncbi:SDR family NAD(P)-dependent oxidoreductase [Candidatus Poribacteria bacterium]|nr:SDR family NAD(P)-dependent oxidoreductase [Candidatus Poribacteria bacterium]